MTCLPRAIRRAVTDLIQIITCYLIVTYSLVIKLMQSSFQSVWYQFILISQFK